MDSNLNYAESDDGGSMIFSDTSSKFNAIGYIAIFDAKNKFEEKVAADIAQMRDDYEYQILKVTDNYNFTEIEYYSVSGKDTSYVYRIYNEINGHLFIREIYSPFSLKSAPDYCNIWCVLIYNFNAQDAIANRKSLSQ